MCKCVSCLLTYFIIKLVKNSEKPLVLFAYLARTALDFLEFCGRGGHGGAVVNRLRATMMLLCAKVCVMPYLIS